MDDLINMYLEVCKYQPVFLDEVLEKENKDLTKLDRRKLLIYEDELRLCLLLECYQKECEMFDCEEIEYYYREMCFQNLKYLLVLYPIEYVINERLTFEEFDIIGKIILDNGLVNVVNLSDEQIQSYGISDFKIPLIRMYFKRKFYEKNESNKRLIYLNSSI